MQKKTKHRILGILVIAALVIISLPLFQGKNELSSETSLVKSPPFPDQSVQLSDDETTTLNANQDVVAIQQPDAPIPIQVANTNTEDQLDDVVTDRHQNVMDIKIASSKSNTAETKPEKTRQENNKEELASNNTLNATPAVEPTPEIKDTIKADNTSQRVETETVKDNKINKRSIQANHTKVLPASVFTTKISDNGLFEIKNAVWVIQLGSFKNKANALRLVNRLRSNGYPAFMQKMSGTFGESTRVYVGPTLKRNAARSLASKIENEMHLRGVVISYKPLTL